MTAGRGRPARRGVSLLEVLLALAIFLLSLAAIAQLVEIGSDRAIETVLQNTGTRLAQAKLAEVEAGVIPPDAGGSGTFDLDPGWNWTVESGSPPVANVYPVTVRVWNEVRGDRYEVSLTQLVFDPRQAATAAAAQPPTAGSTSGGTTP